MSGDYKNNDEMETVVGYDDGSEVRYLTAVFPLQQNEASGKTNEAPEQGRKLHHMDRVEYHTIMAAAWMNPAANMKAVDIAVALAPAAFHKVWRGYHRLMLGRIDNCR